ncbi:MAG: GNAT family N-acetyltransferase [Bacteroides sp.]|nr:GNAT family N-acetyltransferase [Roseburia sp.]MCM1345599.1 GNAT family N-acetyltransferase [Bacteroides sp.]MCM1420766.1 GNAT family N-acetyltransferase [Bacteroides sp.]
MEIKSLDHLSIDEITDSFLEAFSDYAVHFTHNQVKSILRRRGFCPMLTFGMFDNGKLVSFVFNGIGIKDGIPTAYDTGTGTIKSYRGQGLAAEIFRHTEKRLVKQGIARYLLEVLCDNQPAIALYKKLGFEIEREFICYAAPAKNIATSAGNATRDIILRVTTNSNAIQSESYHDYSPSWQSCYASVLRANEELSCIGAWIHGEFAGYAIGDARQGELAQLAVRRDLRRRGIGTALLEHFVSTMQTDSIKILNVDARCGSMISFLERMNIGISSRQYEMSKNLSQDKI